MNLPFHRPVFTPDQIMDDAVDTDIERCLKNWAAARQPPHGLRGRVLLSAAAHSYPVEEPEIYSVGTGHTIPSEFYRSPFQDKFGLAKLTWAFYFPLRATRII